MLLSRDTIFSPGSDFRSATLTVQSATALYSSIIASFFYISALNESLGYGNRIARFLNKAAAIASKISHTEALVLKRTTKVDGRRSRQRESSDLDSFSSRLCIAEFTNVTVTNPFNITLIQNLSMQVKSIGTPSSQLQTLFSSPKYLIPVIIFAQIFSGQGCLISGPSGCGKSSLLRVMGRLWPAAVGSVRIPEHVGPDGVFFLPQSALTQRTCTGAMLPV